MSGPLVLAHRGARRQAPENTLEAFAAARALGADGVELDVRRTTDGGLVVHHDASAPGVGVLAEATLAGIRAVRPEIPTIDEALDACTSGLVNVEIKNLAIDPDWDPDERAAAALVDVLDRRGRVDSVLVSSFDLGAIDRVGERDPGIPTGWLLLPGFDLGTATHEATAREHAAIHPCVVAFVDAASGRVSRAVADSIVGPAHDAGLRVNVWTVNDEGDVACLAAAGVDAVITDEPDVALRALGRAP